MSENVKPEDIKFVHQLCGRVPYSGFVGKCGHGPEHALYLITYSSIVYARDFECDWPDRGEAIPVTVEAFVDIKIDWDLIGSITPPEKGDIWQ